MIPEFLYYIIKLFTFYILKNLKVIRSLNGNRKINNNKEKKSKMMFNDLFNDLYKRVMTFNDL